MWLLLVLVVVGVFRYGWDMPRSRRHLRWNAYYTPGFWASKLRDREPGFQVMSGKAALSWAKPNMSSGCARVFSFSLYGSHPKYFKYMRQNVASIKRHFPGWVPRVYLHEENTAWGEQLRQAGADIVLVRDEMVAPGNSAGMFWRFLPMCEGVDGVVLDADDRLSSSTIRAIRKFFDASPGVVVRSREMFPWPKESLQGGNIMWKREFRPSFAADFIRTYPHRSTFGSDEVFLARHVYPDAHRQGLYKPWQAHQLFVKRMVGTEEEVLPPSALDALGESVHTVVEGPVRAARQAYEAFF
jgi:hypothetical protein